MPKNELWMKDIQGRAEDWLGGPQDFWKQLLRGYYPQIREMLELLQRDGSLSEGGFRSLSQKMKDLEEETRRWKLQREKRL